MANIILIITFCLYLVADLVAQPAGGAGEAYPELKTNLNALETWQDLRFGLFIHWGPVSLRGTEIGWSRGREVPIREYDQLYKEFNPVLFDADQWVTTAQNAGMKYIIFTSKHHDGFCMWDSDFTDYDITSTPFKRDILKELSEACRRQGILFGTYHSICDWHHPDYTTRYGGDPRPLADSHMEVYLKYLKNQIKELIQKYDTDILWFDGEWENSWDHEKGMDLYKYVRDLKDDILINNRVDKGRQGMQGMSASAAFAGDFGTPEQEIGTFSPLEPWESCITLCRQWAWKPNDQMKSLKECIQTLVRTAGGGGNLLLNVGPMLDGRIEQRQIDRLLEVGQWLRKNGESIYGTKGGPFIPTAWLASTCKNKKIFIHLFAWPSGRLILPSLGHANILDAAILNNESLPFIQSGSEIAITLPDNPPDTIDTVVEIVLDTTVDILSPVKVPANKLKDL